MFTIYVVHYLFHYPVDIHYISSSHTFIYTVYFSGQYILFVNSRFFFQNSTLFFHNSTFFENNLLLKQ